MPLIRYPGSKEKLTQELFRFFPDEMILRMWSNAARWEYREPFFGAGAIGFKILGHLHRECAVWLNDFDADLVCLWQAVHKSPNALCGFIHRFKPTTDQFYAFKASDGANADCDPVERGFRKLALHRMSVSGFGVKSGGPIGGRNQTGKEYTVDCRWNPSRLKSDVAKLHKQLSKFGNLQITCGDFSTVLSGAKATTFIYLDPPYFEKGSQLYKYPMNDDDHARLAWALRGTPAHWVLSYDDHPRIRELYSWAKFNDLFITYTNAVQEGGKRPKNREVAITRHAS